MEWTEEEKLAAAERICIGGTEAALEFFKHHPNLGLAVAIQTQCEVTALREALEMTLPLLKEEQSVCEHSFLPEPNLEEQTILTAYSDVIERVESTLARIPK